MNRVAFELIAELPMRRYYTFWYRWKHEWIGDRMEGEEHPRKSL